MFPPWAIPNDPRIALANMDAIFPDKRERVEVYECIACGTTFREEDGEHKNGYLVCPSCWCEDIREITEQEVNDGK